MTQPIDHGDSGDFGDTYKQQPQPVTFASLKGRWRSAMHSQSEMRHKRQCADELESLEQRVRELRDECDRLAKAYGTWAIRTRWAYEQMTEKLSALLGGQ